MTRSSISFLNIISAVALLISFSSAASAETKNVRCADDGLENHSIFLANACVGKKVRISTKSDPGAGEVVKVIHVTQEWGVNIGAWSPYNPFANLKHATVTITVRDRFGKTRALPAADWDFYQAEGCATNDSGIKFCVGNTIEVTTVRECGYYHPHQCDEETDKGVVLGMLGVDTVLIRKDDGSIGGMNANYSTLLVY
jgi:hypothetical protein